MESVRTTMIQSIFATNLGPLKALEWTNLGPINVILGENGYGKTFLLKTTYACLKAIEANKRGDESRTMPEILREKLRTTFQVPFDSLIHKDKTNNRILNFKVECESGNLYFSIDKKNKNLLTVSQELNPREANSIFLPAKEVISLEKIIRQSRDRFSLNGFDDTYYDLSQIVSFLQTPEEIYTNIDSTYITTACKNLQELLHGRLIFDEKSRQWKFMSSDYGILSLGVLAEGVKRLSVLDVLLGNQYLTKNSIIFIDEPESSLHPSAIRIFLEIIVLLAKAGIQFILSTHSYYVIKKLYIEAIKNKIDIPFLSLDTETISYENLKNGLPQNKIIDESIQLYKEEISL